MWLFTSRIFRLALEITFNLASIFPYKWLTSYSRKVENLISVGVGAGGGEGGSPRARRLEIFLKKIS